MNKHSLIAISFSVMIFTRVFSGIVGSNTTPSVQGTTTFPSGDATNEMRGFAAFTSGVTLTDVNTTCLFNDFFPIYGVINPNNGIFNLNKDLVLASNVTLSTGGKFNGNNFSLNLPDKVSSFAITGATTLGNISLVLNSNVSLQSVLTFTNTSVVEGNGYILDLTNAAAKLAVGNSASVLLKNLIIGGGSAGKIFCTDNVSTISLENVTWILDANYSFTQGSLYINLGTIITGGKIFTYQSTKTSIINSNTTLFFDAGMTFSYDTTANNLLSFQDTTALLHLYETTLYANSNGLNLTKGSVVIDGTCPLINDGNSIATSIAIGDGALAANNIFLDILAESGFNITRGFFVNKNV